MPAIEGDIATSSAEKLNWRVPSLSPGEIGCALSHRMCWMEFLRDGDSHCVVFEDDLIVSSELPDMLAERAFIHLNLDIVRLETFRMKVLLTRRPDLRWRHFNFHRLHSRHWGAAGYILSRPHAFRLVTEGYNRDLPVDNLLFNPVSDLFASTKVYQIAPALCIQEKRFWTRGSLDSDLAVSRTVKRPPGPKKNKLRVLLSRERVGRRFERFAGAFFPTEKRWTEIFFDAHKVRQWLVRGRYLERG